MFAACNPDRSVSTAEIGEAFAISTHHLTKVVHRLGKEGFIVLKRGRTGGLRLATTPDQIRIGEVVRRTEPDFHAVECFDRESNTCALVPRCALIAPLRKAMEAFVEELDRYTLADVVGPRRAPEYLRLLGRR